MTKTPLLLLLCIALHLSVKSQIISANFNAPFPSNWTQNPVSTWSVITLFGTAGTPCAISRELNTTTVTTAMKTPALNLNPSSDVSFSFRAALITNNFVIPDVALFYDAGSGPQFVARWGSGISSNTNYTVTGGYDYVPPLDQENINWLSCTHTLSAVSGSVVNFILAAEFVNGGYVLIDDVLITRQASTIGFESYVDEGGLLMFPNPAEGKKLKLTDPTLKEILVFDELGRKFIPDCERTSAGIEINIEHLANGVYYLSALNEKGISIRKKIILE